MYKYIYLYIYIYIYIIYIHTYLEFSFIIRLQKIRLPIKVQACVYSCLDMLLCYEIKNCRILELKWLGVMQIYDIKLRMYCKTEPTSIFSEKPAFKARSNWTPPVEDAQLD